MLTTVFSDKILVAEDDPLINQFKAMSDMGMCKILVLPSVSQERIAEGIYNHVKVVLFNQDETHRMDIRSVELESNGMIVSYIV